MAALAGCTDSLSDALVRSKTGAGGEELKIKAGLIKRCEGLGSQGFRPDLTLVRQQCRRGETEHAQFLPKITLPFGSRRQSAPQTNSAPGSRPAPAFRALRTG